MTPYVAMMSRLEAELALQRIAEFELATGRRLKQDRDEYMTGLRFTAQITPRARRASRADLAALGINVVREEAPK